MVMTKSVRHREIIIFPNNNVSFSLISFNASDFVFSRSMNFFDSINRH